MDLESTVDKLKSLGVTVIRDNELVLLLQGQLNLRKYFIGIEVIEDHVIVYRGDGTYISISKSWFIPNGDTIPDFDDVGILDCGLTVKFGDYEASNASIFHFFDTEFYKSVYEYGD